MSILRSENDNKVALIQLLAGTCLNRTNNKSSLIETKKMYNNVNTLTEAILSTHYKTLLSKKLAVNPNTKGLIKVNANSWLNLIDMDKVTPSMLEFKILPVDDNVINQVVNRLVNEIESYRSILDNSIKPAIEEVNRYKNSIEPAKTLTDLFAVNVVRPMDTLQLLKDKGLLTYNSNVRILASNELKELPTLISKFKDINSITTDPELLMSLKEDMALLDTDDILEDVEEVFTGDILRNINSVPLRELNVLIFIAAIANNLQREHDLDTRLYQELNTLMAVLTSAINAREQKLNFLIENEVLIMSFKNKNGTTILNVIGDVYDKYLETTKGLKQLAGAYLSPMVKSSDRSLTNVEIFLNIKLKDILVNKSELENRADEFNKSLLLTRQNADVNKLRTYFMFGVFNNVKDDDAFINGGKDAATEYINKLSITELGRTEETVLNIFKKYGYKNSNLNIFLEAMEEGNFLLGKNANPKMLAGYASLKLVVLYLATQTDIV